jgi:putative transposase
MTRRAYKYRFYPTDDQKTLLAQTFGCVRFVYNHVLHWRTQAYYENQEKIGYIGANSELSRIKQSGDFPWLSDVSSVPLQQCLRHQQTAFKNFFEGRARYPKFKKKNNRQSAEFTRSAFKYRDGCIYIAKSKQPLDIRWSRELPSEPSTITISKDWAGRYFVSCLCDFEPEVKPVINKTIGVDLGIKTLAACSDGRHIRNPRHTRKLEKTLAKWQRRLAKAKKGGANRAKLKKKVARIHARIADRRSDATHKATRKLINENQVVCVESLKVKNMIRNPKLAKHIADANWGEFVRQLDYKAQWTGRTLVAIDQWFPSSKRCSTQGCGHILDNLSLEIRQWDCPACGTHHDRDLNAANNIEAAGLAVLALGENVSLVSAKSGISCSQ